MDRRPTYDDFVLVLAVFVAAMAVAWTIATAKP